MNPKSLRVITGWLLFIPLAWVVGWGPGWLLWLVVTGSALLGLHEFYKMLEQRDIFCFSYLGLGLAAAGNIVLLKAGTGSSSAIITVWFLACFFYAIISGQDPPEVLPATWGTICGLLYVVWLLDHIIWLWAEPSGPQILLFLLCVVCASDIGAYYAGRRLGRHPFFPHISPNKTREGALGGLLFCMAVAGGVNYFLGLFGSVQALVLGLILGISAQAGDLAESLIKRWANVKNSGEILPGHGGLLDRIDALLFAAPVLYYCIKLLGL